MIVTLQHSGIHNTQFMKAVLCKIKFNDTKISGYAVNLWGHKMLLRVPKHSHCPSNEKKWNKHHDNRNMLPMQGHALE